MIFKILLSRSVQTQNSDKNWQSSCTLQTFVCNISRHLEFIMEHGHRVNWVYGSLDSRVTGSLGHKMWPSSMSGADLKCSLPRPGELSLSSCIISCKLCRADSTELAAQNAAASTLSQKLSALGVGASAAQPSPLAWPAFSDYNTSPIAGFAATRRTQRHHTPVA